MSPGPAASGTVGLDASAGPEPTRPDLTRPDLTRPDGAPVPSRRSLVVGLAATAVGATALASSPDEADAASTDPVLHLLRRATYGPTPALLAKARAQGAKAWLEAQLHPTSIPDRAVDTLMPSWTGQTWRPSQVRAAIPPSGRYAFMNGTVERHLARALWSQRQLFELTVDFWTNHLVVPVPSSEVWDNGHLYQSEVIRRYAFGRYSAMLAAAVRHPALLRVLDLASSTAAAPNENHAREMLELHTVGWGRYTEADVADAARALTGLTVDADGEYAFRPELHGVGPVRVLGWSHPNATAAGGEQVALSLLGYLARHPATARRIATKLAVRFVSDQPPAALVTRLAKVYQAHDTATVPVLRALLTSAEFRASVGQKIRTPYEDAIATLRLLGARPTAAALPGLAALRSCLRLMGQAPMGWPAPNGYPDVAEAWATTSTTLRRWNFHDGAAKGGSAAAIPRLTPQQLMPKKLPTTYGALVDVLAHRFLLTLTSAQRTAVCTFLQHQPGDVLRPADPALGWRLGHVAALVLSSPNFAIR
ncbi:DUF1800 domain-containing protein [uncultured Friedmanniella sp.]|uniref:DUF1800 domain-containing protein n=1 Tax=uncultured Friedmanniella sp. TaxID=335381 RepID=UPI0035CB8DEF